MPPQSPDCTRAAPHMSSPTSSPAGHKDVASVDGVGDDDGDDDDALHMARADVDDQASMGVPPQQLSSIPCVIMHATVLISSLLCFGCVQLPLQRSGKCFSIAVLKAWPH